jgi:hypothetical protein
MLCLAVHFYKYSFGLRIRVREIVQQGMNMIRLLPWKIAGVTALVVGVSKGEVPSKP